MEYGCYTKWFDHIVQKDPPKIDLIGEHMVSGPYISKSERA